VCFVLVAAAALLSLLGFLSLDAMHDAPRLFDAITKNAGGEHPPAFLVLTNLTPAAKRRADE